ncbi:unnamed protein product [Urochloa humidicola]
MADAPKPWPPHLPSAGGSRPRLLAVVVAPPWPPPVTLYLQPPFPVAPAGRMHPSRGCPRLPAVGCDSAGLPASPTALPWSAAGRPVRATVKSLAAPCSSALALHAREMG